MQRSFGPSRSPTYYRYTSSSYESGQMKRYTLLWASFSRNPRDAIVCACACACVCVCVRTTWNERREEERENVEKERERGGSTFPACNYVGILTVEESFLDRLAMHWMQQLWNDRWLQGGRSLFHYDSTALSSPRIIFLRRCTLI